MIRLSHVHGHEFGDAGNIATEFVFHHQAMKILSKKRLMKKAGFFSKYMKLSVSVSD